MHADTTHPFDEATRLTPGADGWTCHTHDAYANMHGPFGGVTAATMLGAALERAGAVAQPVAMTANFCAPIRPGALLVRAREVRAGKSVQHLAVEMHQDDGTVVASASVVLAARRESWAHQVPRMPDVPCASEVAPLDTRGYRLAWLQRFEFRFIEGAPELGRTPRREPASAASTLWIRDAPARALDFKSLASLCDTFFLRIFQVRGVLVPAGTVSVTMHFHAGADDLARQGERPLLGRAWASVFRRNFSDQAAQLWSDDGKLLATSTQIAWFKQ